MFHVGTQSSTRSESAQADARKVASQCFARAGEAIRQGQYDYALQLYRRCCEYQPESLLFRQALRETVKRQLGKHPARQWFRRLWVRGKMRRARLRRDDRSLLDACEQALSVDPENTTALLEQARACTRLGYKQLAVWDLESVLELDPEHAKAARELARLYEHQGTYEKAARLWTLLRARDPRDTEARQRWRALQHGIAEQLGHTPEESPKEDGDEEDVMTLLTLPRRAAPAESVPAEEPRSPAEELQRRVSEDPADVERQLELAQHWVEKGEYDQARRVLHEVLQTSGNALRVQERWEDLDAEVLRFRAQKAQEMIATQPDDQAAHKRLKALQMELNDYELDLYRRRAERYPERAEFRYEFALRLSRAGLVDEAILQLTGVRKNPQLRLRAAVLMAECFVSQGQRLRARQCYEEALHAPSAWDEPVLLEEARRRLAELADD